MARRAHCSARGIGSNVATNPKRQNPAIAISGNDRNKRRTNLAGNCRARGPVRISDETSLARIACMEVSVAGLDGDGYSPKGPLAAKGRARPELNRTPSAYLLKERE